MEEFRPDELSYVVSSSHFDHSGQAMAQSEPRSWQLSLLAPPWPLTRAERLRHRLAGSRPVLASRQRRSMFPPFPSQPLRPEP